MARGNFIKRIFGKGKKPAKPSGGRKTRGGIIPGFGSGSGSGGSGSSGGFLDNFKRGYGSGSSGGNTSNDNNTVSVPSPKNPGKKGNESRASVTTLNRQLKDLAAIAVRIGVVTKEQQDTLLKQILAENRAAREAQVESKVAEPVSGAMAGGSSLDILATSLLGAIGALTAAVEDKIQESDTAGGRFLDGFYGAYGLGGVRGAAKAKAKVPKLRRGFSFDEKSKRYYKQGPGGRRSFVKEEDALRNAKKADLRTTAARMRRAEKHAEKVAKATKTGGAAAGVANVIGRAAKKVGGGAATATKTTIARIAGPLVKSAVAKTAIKAIPIVGAVAGLGFAVGRLMDGDYVGAGLDAVSGLGGPITAIPALVAAVARDAYSGTFGVQPEQDPLSSERMAMVTSIVAKMVKDWLKGTVKDANPVAEAPVTNRRSGAAIRSQVGMAKPAAAAAAVSRPAPTSRPSPAPSTYNPPARPSSSGSRGSSGGSSSPSPSPSPMSAAPPPPATPVQAVQRDASVVMAASEAQEMPPQRSTMPNSPYPTTPASSQTTRTGAAGMGNVPDPTYYNYTSSMLGQMYFGAAA